MMQHAAEKEICALICCNRQIVFLQRSKDKKLNKVCYKTSQRPMSAYSPKRTKAVLAFHLAYLKFGTDIQQAPNILNQAKVYHSKPMECYCLMF